MKKILITSAFMIAGIMSANNVNICPEKSQIQNEETKKHEIIQINDEKPTRACGVFITYYDSEGNVAGTQTFTTDVETLDQCTAYQTVIKFSLMMAGFTLS